MKENAVSRQMTPHCSTLGDPSVSGYGVSTNLNVSMGRNTLGKLESSDQ